MKELSVAAALENVYAAFASVPRPKKIEGCPCCTTPERLAVLTAGPLRSLDEELLSWYGFKSMTTIGDEQDYLYSRVSKARRKRDVNEDRWGQE